MPRGLADFLSIPPGTSHRPSHVSASRPPLGFAVHMLLSSLPRARRAVTRSLSSLPPCRTRRHARPPPHPRDGPRRQHRQAEGQRRAEVLPGVRGERGSVPGTGAERCQPGLWSDLQQRGLGSCERCLPRSSIACVGPEPGWEPASSPCQPRAVGTRRERSEHGSCREKAECAAARRAPTMVTAVGVNGSLCPPAWALLLRSPGQPAPRKQAGIRVPCPAFRTCSPLHAAGPCWH